VNSEICCAPESYFVVICTLVVNAGNVICYKLTICYFFGWLDL